MAWLELDGTRTDTRTVRCGALSGVAVLALFVVGLSGCKSADSSTSTAPAPSASAAEAPVDPKTKRHVTPKDCDAWSEHGASVMVSSITATVGACPPETRQATLAKFAGDPADIRASAKNLCMSHATEEYAAGSAACYMAATDAPTLKECDFGPMTNANDTDWPAFVDFIRKTCMEKGGPPPTVAPSPAAPPASAPNAKTTKP